MNLILSKIQVNLQKNSQVKNHPLQNARHVRIVNIKMVLMKWFPLSQPHIYHLKLLQVVYAHMNKSMFQMHIRRHLKIMVKFYQPTFQ